MTGYTTNTYTTTIFTCSLALNAIRLNNGQLDDELWNVIAVSSCEDGLRPTFPAMITAIRNYVTNNSQKQVTVVVDSNNPNAVFSEK